MTPNPILLQKQSEFVRGQIIGGDYYQWQVFYDGRPQSQRLPADSDTEAEELGRAEIARIKEWCGSVLWLIHPHDTWEVRIWSPS